MVVWTGFGFLIAIIGFGALVGTEYAVESLMGNEQYYQNNPWLIFVGMLVAAAVTYILNKTILISTSQTVIDKASQEEMVITKDHSLFFIASKWWPIIYIVIGIVATIAAYNTN